MSQRTEKKLNEVTLWYRENADNCKDPFKRTDFTMRALWHLLWLFTYMIEDIQKLENRHGGLILFKGAVFHDPLREEGQ